jgi:hypothetical protein
VHSSPAHLPVLTNMPPIPLGCSCWDLLICHSCSIHRAISEPISLTFLPRLDMQPPFHASSSDVPVPPTPPPPPPTNSCSTRLLLLIIPLGTAARFRTHLPSEAQTIKLCSPTCNAVSSAFPFLTHLHLTRPPATVVDLSALTNPAATSVPSNLSSLFHSFAAENPSSYHCCYTSSCSFCSILLFLSKLPLLLSPTCLPFLI